MMKHQHFYPQCLFFISFHHHSVIQFERENEKKRLLCEYLLSMDHSLWNSYLEEPFNSGRFFLFLVQFSFFFFSVSFLLVLTSRLLQTLTWLCLSKWTTTALKSHKLNVWQGAVLWATPLKLRSTIAGGTKQAPSVQDPTCYLQQNWLLADCFLLTSRHRLANLPKLYTKLYMTIWYSAVSAVLDHTESHCHAVFAEGLKEHKSNQQQHQPTQESTKRKNKMPIETTFSKVFPFCFQNSTHIFHCSFLDILLSLGHCFLCALQPA